MPLEQMELLEEPKTEAEKKAEKEALKQKRNQEKERLKAEKLRLKEENRKRKEEERLAEEYRKEQEQKYRELEELENEQYRQQYKSKSFFDRFDEYTLDTDGKYGDVRAEVHNAKVAQWKNKSFSQKVLGFDVKRGFKNSFHKVKRFLGMKHDPIQPVNGTENQKPGSYQMKKFDLPDNFFSEYAMQDALRKQEWEKKDKEIAEQKKKEEDTKASEVDARKKELERHKEDDAHINSVTEKLSAHSGQVSHGALYRGFNMPYGAGFSAPGPSIADRFSFSGANNSSQLLAGNEDLSIENPVEVNKQTN